jgi:hypothetical protein
LPAMAVYQATCFSQTHRIRGQARSYSGCGRAITFAVLIQRYHQQAGYRSERRAPVCAATRFLKI